MSRRRGCSTLRSGCWWPIGGCRTLRSGCWWPTGGCPTPRSGCWWQRCWWQRCWQQFALIDIIFADFPRRLGQISDNSQMYRVIRLVSPPVSLSVLCEGVAAIAVSLSDPLEIGPRWRQEVPESGKLVFEKKKSKYWKKNTNTTPFHIIKDNIVTC